MAWAEPGPVQGDGGCRASTTSRSEESQLSTDEGVFAGGSSTAWDGSTSFSLVSAVAEEALRESRKGKSTKILGRMISRDAGSTHACDGELLADVYFDGSWHVGVFVWYECDHHLEILGDITIPKPA